MQYKKHKWEEWIGGYERCCQCGLLKEMYKRYMANNTRITYIQYRGYISSRSATPTVSSRAQSFVCDDFRLKENESGMDAGKIGNEEPQKNEGGTI